ncbi:MAG: AEC family transporter [Hyphomicrobiales bacterium]|nr:AEC family transporter [Hyphomicrobiales bacterium]
MLQELFNIIAPVFVCAGIGFTWARMGRPYDTEMVTALVTAIGAPCLIFNTLLGARADGAALVQVGGATVAAVAIFAAVGVAGLMAFRLPLRAFLPTLMFPNAGNMGIPLCFLAFGDTGLALSIAIFTVYCVLQFTLGVSIAAGSLSLGRLARVPLIYAVAAAVAMMALDLPVPKWIDNTTRLLGGLTIPMMLITLGFSLAKLRVASLGRGVALAVARLVLGFSVGLLVATLFGLEGAARGVVILECAMPVAVFNYLFAQRYGNRPEEVAGVVVASAILAFVTLPALLWYVI